MNPSRKAVLDFAQLSAQTFERERLQQPALALFAVGMIGLGIVASIYGDFALVWQPAAAWVPGGRRWPMDRAY